MQCVPDTNSAPSLHQYWLLCGFLVFDSIDIEAVEAEELIRVCNGIYTYNNIFLN